MSSTDRAIAAPAPRSGLLRRIHHGTRKPANWMQLLRSGSSAVAATWSTWRLRAAQRRSRRPPHRGRDRRLRVAVINNFWWNRHWTFDAGDGHAGFQAARFFTVSVVGLGVNLVLLELFVTGAELAGAAGAGARGRADDAGELRRQQAVDVRRLGTALAACLALTVPLLGAPTPAAAQDGSVAGSTAPIPAEPDYLPPTPDDFSVSAAEAVEIANADPKVAEQSARYGELTTAISVNDDNLWQVGYKDGDNEVGAGQDRRRHRGDHRVLDRLSGRLADGARLRGPVRPPAQRALRLDPDGAGLPRRALRLPPPGADRPPRPAGAALVRDLALLLQRRRDRRLGPARLPAARLPARTGALDRLPRRRRAAPVAAGALAGAAPRSS